MNPSEILDGIKRLSALVVGDICLDRWCTYEPSTSEPSRETGIPRVGVVSTEATAGAGGTVANNLAVLGTGRVSVLGLAGDDGFGHELSRALRKQGVDLDLLVVAPSMPTFTYTKLINAETGMEDRPRIDYIYTKPIPTEIETALVERLRSYAAAFDLILVSDQAETEFGGVVTGAVRDELSRLARIDSRKVVWVDSRMRAELFRDVIVKPNLTEASGACHRAFGKVDYHALRRIIGGPFLFVTDGPNGVSVISEKGEERVAPAVSRNPVDICGAGDSFSAGAACALAITGSPVEAARFGNLVASITIMKKGTGTASPAEVLEASS